MHILVTDRLACARCGPGFGLILMADELEERRVLEGALACPNCRARYPVRAGFGDLRAPPREAEEASEPLSREDPEAATRLAALIGVREGPGLLLVVGPSAGHAGALSRRIEGIEVVAVHPDLRDEPEQAGVSRIAASERLPFLSGSVRGVVLEGKGGRALIGEAARVLGTGCRLVLLSPDTRIRSDLAAHGLKVLIDSDSAVLCVRK